MTKKAQRIYDTTDLSIGQLYMYGSKFNTSLRRGICIKITEDTAEFREYNHTYSDKLHFHNSSYNTDRVYVYNASIFNKYNKLLEQQQKERDNLLLGKDEIVVQEIADKKWYDRFLRKKKNNEQ